VHAAKSLVANVVCANALVITVIKRHVSVSATFAHITLVNSAGVVIVAKGGGVLPLAKLSHCVASILGAKVSIIALKVRAALTAGTAEQFGLAEASGRLASIMEARAITTARDLSREAFPSGLITGELSAIVGGTGGAITRSRLAADATDSIGGAE